jgi:hypothetical protein
MDTRMLGRVVALLIRDLGKSRVIFLALARGQELVVLGTCSQMLSGLAKNNSRMMQLQLPEKT